MTVDRRAFLAIAGASLVLSGCAAIAPVAGPPVVPSPSQPPMSPPPPPAPTPTVTAPAVPVALPTPVLNRVPVPAGTLTDLPGEGNLLAWTVDDGSNADVVARYTQFAKETGTRLTYFLNGSYDSWSANADLIRPLVASGQIQLGNHTWSHVDLTELSDDGVTEELQRNHDFITDTYGVDARPYFRPPFGFHDDRVDSLAADLGYTVPTLWYGTLSDSGLITKEQVVQFATDWFLPQHIVIGHLNFDPVCSAFPQLHALIQERGLQTVTLNDVFVTDKHP